MKEIVVFTGAGVSAESGLKTFRGGDGLWRDYSVYDVATPEAWARDPELVLDFYNERLISVREAEPNEAHRALAELEKKYSVTIVTQNIDDLHERAGSSRVVHLHGEITKARSSVDRDLVYEVGERGFRIGDTCEKGSQLRPAVVWFGEEVVNYGLARRIAREADIFLVVGTSLVVYPAAALVEEVRRDASKYVVSLDLARVPFGFEWIREKAAVAVPKLARAWLADE